MKQNRIFQIAEMTHTSPATVSKVLNHRHGVSAEVRQAVFDVSDRLGGNKDEAPVGVYIIMPEIPRYFWGREYRDLTPAGMRVKYNIYSRIGDDAIVLRYLRQAIALEAKAIVIAARLNDEMRALLDDFAQSGLVIYLTEYNRTRDSVYVGSDPAEDGRRLATLCRRHVGPDDRLLLLPHALNSWGETSQIRQDAFLDELAGDVPYGSYTVDFAVDTSLMASLIARQIRPLLASGAYNRVVCFSGFTHVLCLAVQKMHLEHPIACFGFEDTPRNGMFAELGYLGGVVAQDFREQLAASLALAVEFVQTGRRPDRDRVIIPGKIIDYCEEEHAPDQ